MLKEIENLLQKDGDEIHRRWFSDQQIELIVWYENHEELVGFQLIYFIDGEEHAFTWKESTGFHCTHVDKGEPHVAKNMTPVLVEDRVVAIDYITKLFITNCSELDPHISQLVIQKLKDWRSSHK